MKILMLCEFYDAALEFQENLLVKYYRKHGHDVTVVTSTFESVFDYYNDRYDANRPAKTEFDQGATIIRLPYRYNLMNRLRAYTRIDRILAAEAPDLVYVHDVMPNLPEAIRYVRSRPDCRMILDYHADYSNSGKNWLSLKVLHGVLRKRLLDQARPFLSRIFPVVPAGVTFLHEVYKVPLSEMEVLPLGADMDLGRAVRARHDRGALRRRLGIADEEIAIFTGGKLTPYRQTEILLNALRSLAHQPLRVLIVGDSGKEHAPYQESLRIAAEGLPNVRFTGWLGREQIYEHMFAADIAVFPASQSIMWQQAISMGLPLIVGDTARRISYLNLQENIVILRGEQLSAQGFAQALERVIATPGRLAAMSAGAHRVAAEHLDWDTLVDRTLRFNRAPSTAVERLG